MYLLARPPRSTTAPAAGSSHSWSIPPTTWGRATRVALTADGLPVHRVLRIPRRRSRRARSRSRGRSVRPPCPASCSRPRRATACGSAAPSTPSSPSSQANGVVGPVRAGADAEARPHAGEQQRHRRGVAGDGTVHVAWVMGNGVYHAVDQARRARRRSTKSTTLPGTVDQAGPIGRPGITLDADGNPWIAFTAERERQAQRPRGPRRQREVDRRGCGDRRDLQRLSRAAADGHRRGRLLGRRGLRRRRRGHDPGGRPRTAPAWTHDPGGRWRRPRPLLRDRRRPRRWPRTTRGAKSVEAATFDGTSWTSTTVADAADPDPSVTGNLAPVTSTRRSPRTGPSTSPGSTTGCTCPRAPTRSRRSTSGTRPRSGAGPSLAASDNGVALSWYETQQQNLMVGLPRRSPGRAGRAAEPVAHGVASTARRWRVRRQDRGARRGGQEPRLRERLSGGSGRASRSRSPSTTRTPASSTTSRSSRTPRRPTTCSRRHVTGVVDHHLRRRRRSTQAPTSSTATCTRHDDRADRGREGRQLARSVAVPALASRA